MPIDLDAQLLGMSVLEIVAAVLGLVSVWLTVKQNVWCWPIGAGMVALYAVVFWRVKLYADAGLQVIYFALQFYGWYQWLHGGEGREELPVSRTPRALLVMLLALGLAGTEGLGCSLSLWTDQAVPYFDSAIAVFSLVAQWMLAKKLLENWLVWVGVDTLGVGVYFYKALYPTAVLYGIFWLMALAGYLEWRRSPRPPSRAAAADVIQREE